MPVEGVKEIISHHLFPNKVVQHSSCKTMAAHGTVGIYAPPSLNASQLKAEGLKLRNLPAGWLKAVLLPIWYVTWLPSMTSLSTPTTGQNGSQHML